ncbi:MAG: SRPBCC family protein [Solirubrobacteraceae bacterium]
MSLLRLPLGSRNRLSGLAMSKVARQRTIAASQLRVWEVLEDPHHLPRWWPGIQRVEGVRDDRWTDVFVTKRGRPVRADFHLLVSDRPWRRCWEQELQGTPFERVLAGSITDVTLASAGDGTLVTIAQQQKLRGYSRTGGLLLRRAGARKLDEALEGLDRVCAG